jgi:HlyD family secretion protein
MVMKTREATQKKLYRQEAIDRAASPDPVDYLSTVVGPKRWLSLFGLGGLVLAGTAWSLLGKIPVTVMGKGVLVYPSDVATVQASGNGRILNLAEGIKPGAIVTKGQVLATIDQSELKQQLELAEQKLIQLKIEDDNADRLRNRRNSEELSARFQERQSLENSLTTAKALNPVLQDKGMDSIASERVVLESKLAKLRASLPDYKQRFEVRQVIQKEGAISQDVMLQAKQEYEGFQAEIDQLESQLIQLDAKEVEAQRQYLDNTNQINEIQSKITALEVQGTSQFEQDATQAVTRRKEMRDTTDQIAQLKLQLANNSTILSTAEGTILELSAKVGAQIQPGAAILTLATQKPDTQLRSIVFLPVQDGNRVKKDMTVQVTPKTVKREEVGGMIGTVTEVSQFPITQQGAANLIGNPDILPDVLGKGANVAVFVDLKKENGRYRWSAANQVDQPITSGTTTDVRIELESRTPMSYFLPFLKDMLKVK